MSALASLVQLSSLLNSANRQIHVITNTYPNSLTTGEIESDDPRTQDEWTSDVEQVKKFAHTHTHTHKINNFLNVG